MKLLVSLMLMVAFVTATVSAASADLSMQTCSSQLRADDMCYATALPPASAESPKKGGACFELILNGAVKLIPPQAQNHVFAPGHSVLSGLIMAVPLRPPRA